MHNKFARWLGSLVFACATVCQAQQGMTPFVPPPPVPAQGQAFHKDDPAYPKYLDIYDQIQASFGSASALESAAKAINDLQHAYPSSPYPLFAQAEYLYALSGQSPQGNAEAMAIVDRAMRMGGADIPDGYIFKAKNYADMGYGDVALESAEVAARFAPDKPESQFALARAEDAAGKHAEAEAAFRKFIALVSNPQRKANGYAWIGLSLSHTDLPRAVQIANHAKAAEALRMSAELGPTHAHLMHYAKYLMTDIGDTDAAAVQLGKVLARNSSDDPARVGMGLVEYLKWARANPKGQHAAALDTVERQWGLSKEDAFVVSAQHVALEPVVLAMLQGHAIKNINVKNVNVTCYDNCLSFAPGATALASAVYADSEELTKRLVEHGANVNLQVDQDRTPLMYALLNDNTGLAAYLIGKGAKVNAKAEDGMTPLEIAISHPASSQKTVSLLLAHHADPTVITVNGKPMVFSAVTRNNPDALQLLLGTGKIDVNLKDNHGLTLLYFALHYPDMVRLLLAKGADPWGDIGGQGLMFWAQAFSAESAGLIQEARNKQPKK